MPSWHDGRQSKPGGRERRARESAPATRQPQLSPSLPSPTHHRWWCPHTHPITASTQHNESACWERWIWHHPGTSAPEWFSVHIWPGSAYQLYPGIDNDFRCPMISESWIHILITPFLKFVLRLPIFTNVTVCTPCVLTKINGHPSLQTKNVYVHWFSGSGGSIIVAI